MSLLLLNLSKTNSTCTICGGGLCFNISFLKELEKISNIFKVIVILINILKEKIISIEQWDDFI